MELTAELARTARGCPDLRPDATCTRSFVDIDKSYLIVACSMYRRIFEHMMCRARHEGIVRCNMMAQMEGDGISFISHSHRSISINHAIGAVFVVM